ncbi:MAG: 2-oxoacid:acceptor oxidoreductase family protein [Desulfobacterales bacterium]|jgi:2-oxoglutarate ferredoxin oxidoreductase subunit gamma
MRTEVKLAGFGGQGIILMSVMLANAAGYYEDREIAQTQSYGPEARGGACQAAVVISDRLIDYTKCLNPDIFAAMSQEALDKYIGGVDPEKAQIFIDDSLVKHLPEKIKYLHCIPATQLAEEHCGNKMTANTLMLAAIIKLTGLISVDALRTTIKEHLPAKIQTINLKALEVALNYCEKKASTK